jgi:hypothetical protein
MNTTVWERIAEVPWWLYVVTSYVIYFQFQAMKTRTIPLKQMAIPAFSTILMTCMLLTFELMRHPHLINQSGLRSYLTGGIIAGLLVGWLQIRIRGIKLTASNELLIPRARWQLLLFIFAAFAGIYVKSNYGIAWMLNPLVICLSFTLVMGMSMGQLTGLIFQTRIPRS